MSSPGTPSLRLFADDESEAVSTDSKTPVEPEVLSTDRINAVQDLLDVCGKIERGVHPNMLVDRLKGNDRIPDYREITNVRLEYYNNHVSLLSAARGVFGADFQSLRTTDTRSTFDYKCVLDDANVETEMDDVEHLLEEIIQLEQLIYSVREACAGILPPDFSGSAAHQIRRSKRLVIPGGFTSSSAGSKPLRLKIFQNDDRGEDE